MSLACTNDDAGMLLVSGELDVHTGPDVARAALAALDQNPGGSTVTLDLSELTFLDCAGVSALLAARRRVLARGGHLNLVRVPERVRHLLTLTGVAPAFPDDEQRTIVLPATDDATLPLRG